jgi:hypothetical protein
VTTRQLVLPHHSGRPSALRRAGAAGAAVLTLVASTLVTPLSTAWPAQAAPEDVVAAGRVFADFDGDGLYDGTQTEGLREQGIGNVTVTVTDALGRSATTLTDRTQVWAPGDPADTPEDPNDPTDPEVTPGRWVWEADGDWSMTEREFTDQTGEAPFVKAGEDGARLRVVFSGLPDQFESWFAGDRPGNGTSVQLVQAGDEEVDYAVLRPAAYSHRPMDTITAIQSAGDPQNESAAARPALSVTDFDASQESHSYMDLDKNDQYDQGIDELAPLDPDGEEYRYYQDLNQDGFWDQGEPGSDVAFVDENGNGQWDAGPYTNATLYAGLPTTGATTTVVPQTMNGRVLYPGSGNGCWLNFTVTERLVDQQTVPDDPATDVDESSDPRSGAYLASVQVPTWCPNSPGTVTGVFVPGGNYDGEPQFRQARTVNLTQPEDPFSVATYGEVGAVWGASYEQSSNAYLFSAVYKRISGLAEHRWGGSTQRALGGIFRLPGALDLATGKVDPDRGLDGNVEPWFSLVDLGIDVGSAESNAERGLGTPVARTADQDAFANAAKVGIGGIDTWTNGTDTTLLYVMNLADRNVYRIDISPTNPNSPDHDPDFVPTADDVLQIPLGLTGPMRPWAVEVYADHLYVGWADAGDAPGRCATMSRTENQPPDWTDCGRNEAIRYYAGRTNLDGSDGITEVMNSDLGYPRGNPIGNWGDQGDRYAQENPQVRRWNTWTDEWTWDATDDTGPGSVPGGSPDGWPDGSVGRDLSGGSAWSSGHYVQVYPQAIVSSLGFDKDGFLSVAIMDRTSLQGGNIQWAADAEEQGGTSQDIYFETVTSGDTQIAGWDPGRGAFWRERGGRVSAVGRDGLPEQRFNSTADHHQAGPGGREFYDDDQALDSSARGAGQIQNHEEVTLGSVLSVPGAKEIGVTAYDPLINIRTQGLMGLDADTGLPVRAVELTPDPGHADHPDWSFQKGGGLGDLDALALPAPVEIGNRFWFDADQDGHQSADEAGIGGVEVELLDAAGEVLATQITSDDGTYYFSSHNADTNHWVPDPEDPDNPAVSGLKFGLEYTVRFVRPEDGALQTDLWGIPVSASWDSVPFTEQQVTAGDNPHGPDDNADGVSTRPAPEDGDEAAALTEPTPPTDPDRTDSNPAVDSGEYNFELGGPGQNDHSIDAGVVAHAPLDVLKLIDAQGPNAPPGTTFDIALDTTDFRGLAVGPDAPDPDAAFTFEQLAQLEENAALVTDADPDGIADGALTLEVGQDGTVPVARVCLPVGTTVQVTEVDSDTVEQVSYSPEGPVLLDEGVGCAAEVPARATVRVTNTLATGQFTAAKVVEGAGADLVPDGTSFSMQYSTDGGTSWVDFTVGHDADDDGVPAAFTSPDLPLGQEIQVREQSGAPPTGVEWSGVTIAGQGVTYDPGTGIAVFVLTVDSPEIALTVTNTADLAPGGFQVVKTVTGPAAVDVPDSTVFLVEYSTDGGQTWQPLEVLADGTPVGVDDLSAGATVMVREPEPMPTVEGVVWGTPMITVGDGTPQPGPVSFVVDADETVSLTVTNLAEEEPGTFSVRKIVLGGAAAVVAQSRPTFTLEYAVDDDGDPTTVPNDLEWATIEIPWGQVAFPDDEFEPGTVIFVREAEPLPDVDGVVWGDPQLFVDGEPAPGEGQAPASITITPGDQASPVVTMLNTAQAEPGWFTISKSLQGPAAGQVPDGTTFTVEYTVAGGEPVQVDVPLGETITVSDVPAGAEVTIGEAELPEVPGVAWGTPVLTVDGIPQDATETTFTVEAGTGVAVGVTNAANPAPGIFTATKTVAGDAADDVPDGTEFLLEYSTDAGQTWAGLTVPLGAPAISADLPAGTQVWIREGALPVVPGVQWGEPVISGDGVSTDPENGYGTLIVSPGTTVELTLTNTADQAPGGFDVIKAVTGDGAAGVPTTSVFTMQYSLDDGTTWQDLQVRPDGVPVGADDLPAGTVVLLRETEARPDPPYVQWGDVTISGTGVDYDPVTGVATFTIGAGTRLALIVTNEAQPTGTFSVLKVPSGDAVSEAPTGGYTIHYTYVLEGQEQEGTADLTLGSRWTSPELPTGTEVTVTEVDLPDLPDGVTWGDPVFSGRGVTINPDGSATLTIGNSSTIATNLVNPIDYLPGTFTLLKEIGGQAADQVPDGTTFTLAYTVGGSEPVEVELTAGEEWSSPELPYGAEVTVTELAPPDVPGVEWGDPVLTVDGDPVDGDSATFTIGAGTTVGVVVTNDADDASGSFSVAKQVIGEGADEVSDSQVFRIEFSADGGETWSTVVVDGSGTPAALDAIEPGTEIMLREAERPAVDGVDWGDITITGQGVEYDTETGVATFTVEADTLVELVVTNEALQTDGVFTLEKLLDGPAADDVPDDTQFTFTYTVDGGPAQTVAVTVEDPWTSPELPYGAQVALDEMQPPQVDGIVWDGPAWSLDGEPATAPVTFTIGDGTAVAVTATNTAEPAPGAFSVQKLLDGSGAGAVPEDTEFTIQYTVDDGPPQQQTLTAGQTWTSADLDSDAEVTITELDLPDIEGIEWGEPVWTLDGEPADGPVTFTLTAGTTVAVELTNTAELATGRFAITKQVDGEAADEIPNDARFTFRYTIDDGAPQTATVGLDEPWVSDQAYPAGTVVTVSEVSAPDLPGVRWSDVTVSGEGVEFDPQTGIATFTVPVGTGVTVEATNTAHFAPGDFSVIKTVSGEAESDVPDDTVFVLEYSTDDGDSWRTLDVPLGETVTSDELAAGSRVLLREGPRPEVEGVTWGEPSFTIDDEPVTGDVATITIGAARTVAFEMQNVANIPPHTPPSASPTEPPAGGRPPADQDPFVPWLPGLPRTGSNVLALGGIALLLVLIGAAFVTATRRRGQGN